MSHAQNANVALKQKVFSINSADKLDSNSRSDAFNVRTEMPYRNEMDKVTLIEADVPKSYYMLDSDETFTLAEATGTVDTTVTISGGRNYSATQLATEIAAKLTAASATGANTFTYTCTFDDTTGKFTITASSGEFTLELANDALLAKYFGMVADDSSNVSSSSVLVSSNIVNLQRYDVIHIRSSMINNNNDDTMARIYPSDVAYLDKMHYVANDPKLMSGGLNDNIGNESGFCVTDKDRNAINFNGVDVQFTVVAFKDSDKTDI